MKDIFTGFIAFLRGTSLNAHKTSLNACNKVSFTIRVLLILWLIKLSIGLINSLLVKAHIIDYSGNNDSLRNWLAHTSTLEFLTEVVLVGPLLEELAFRGILQQKLQLVWIGFGSFLYILISNGLRIDYYTVSSTTIAVLGCSALSSWLLRPTISRFIGWTSSVSRYQTFIWVSAFGFALLHYSNYPTQGVRVQTIVAMLLPHLIAGLLLSWTAQRNGLRWSIYLHILNNALPALLILKERHVI